MDWRRIPHAEGYEMSESGDVRRADGLLVPYYRLLWGGRHAVMSAETLYRMTFDGPLPERSSGAPHSVDVDERRLEAARAIAEYKMDRKTTSSAPGSRRSASIFEVQDENSRFLRFTQRPERFPARPFRAGQGRGVRRPGGLLPGARGSRMA